MKLLQTLTLLAAVVVGTAPVLGEEKVSQPKVKLVTSAGDITLRLYPAKAPKTVENFLAYVDEGFYDGTIFHRVINNFMIQAGGFDSERVEKETRDPIVNESRNKLHNIRGTVAMARTSSPDSATAQFFINQRSNLRLDWAPDKEGYTVFGEVIAGMGVVDFIATAATGNSLFTTASGQRPFQDVPIEAIVIKKAVRVGES